MPAMASLANGGAKNFGQTSRVGYAWGGHPNLVYRSGSNFVHICNSSQVFIPTRALSNVEYLVIGGGGGGGGSYGGGGGGGAGGYRSSVVGETSGGGAAAEARLSFSAYQHVTVTVGAGGTGVCGMLLYGHVPGLNGSASTFGTITASGGGGGGGHNSERTPYDTACTTPATHSPPGTGGSGGGGGGGYNGIYACNVCAFPGAAGTGSQGYAGGAGNAARMGDGACTCGPECSRGHIISGGGGGGAGGAGSSVTYVTFASGTPLASGNGGAGRASSITGVSVTRAGGGAGGVRTRSNRFSVGTSSGGGGRNSQTGTTIPWYTRNSPTEAMAGYWPGPEPRTLYWGGPGFYDAPNSYASYCSTNSYIENGVYKQGLNPGVFSPQAGQQNTGGGGGGNVIINGDGGFYDFDVAGFGGSGVVIVRYAA